jgi:hypothetical protein
VPARVSRKFVAVRSLCCPAPVSPRTTRAAAKLQRILPAGFGARTMSSFRTKRIVDKPEFAALRSPRKSGEPNRIGCSSGLQRNRGYIMKTIAAMVIALSLAALHPVAAKEHYNEPGVKADTKEAFASIAEGVRKEMEDGGRFEYVKPDERKTVESKLVEMDQLFEKKSSVTDMTQDEKVALFNAQETVNAILTRRDRDRVICKNQAPIGSHIPVTTCHTYGQEVEGREGTKKIMNEWQRAPCVGDNPACHAQ